MLDSLPTIAIDDNYPRDQTVHEKSKTLIEIDCLENQNRHGFAHRVKTNPDNDNGESKKKTEKLSWINRQLFKVTWRLLDDYFEDNGVVVDNDECYTIYTDGARNGVLQINIDRQLCPIKNRNKISLTCELEYIGHRMQSIAKIRGNQFGPTKLEAKNVQLGWINDHELITDVTTYPSTGHFDTRRQIKWLSRKIRINFKCKLICYKHEFCVIFKTTFSNNPNQY